MPTTPPSDNKQEQIRDTSDTKRQYVTESEVMGAVLDLHYLFRYYEIMEEINDRKEATDHR